MIYSLFFIVGFVIGLSTFYLLFKLVPQQIQKVSYPTRDQQVKHNQVIALTDQQENRTMNSFQEME